MLYDNHHLIYRNAKCVRRVTDIYIYVLRLLRQVRAVPWRIDKPNNNQLPNDRTRRVSPSTTEYADWDFYASRRMISKTGPEKHRQDKHTLHNKMADGRLFRPVYYLFIIKLI